ncbi:MAG: CoA transferase [Rhodospirillales bacterium]|nr:CoA transferase [Rhodospirillales bacterium]
MFLAGLRVLDLSQYIPGPYAAQLLADFGAHVLKIEPPGGDPMRGLGPRDADGVSPLWKGMNAGKSVLELDLKSEGGTALLRDLIARADVLVESYRPGTLDRLGFGRAALEALNPRLVHVALSGYGQTGPWRLRTGHDINYMATGGGLWASGTSASPQIAHPPTADFASAQFAALAACAALLGRAASGKGAYIDASLTDTVAGWQGPLLAQHGRPGFAQDREAGLLNGGTAFYRVYACADGHVTLGAIEPKFWANFCEAVGRPGWIARQGEKLPQTALIADVAALFAGRSRAEWEAVLGPVDCCFAAVVPPGEMEAHPQLAARGLIGRLPAYVDGAPPPVRPPVAFCTAASVRAQWGLC